MSKRRNLIFGLVRGLAAICIALLVATVLIFICAEGGSFSQKLLYFFAFTLRYIH